METQNILKYPDYFMIIGYFVLMLAIGFIYRSMKVSRNISAAIIFPVAQRCFYMSSFSVMAFINSPSLCYRFGFVGVTLLWVAVPATLFSTVFLPTDGRARIEPGGILNIAASGIAPTVFRQGVHTVIDDGIKLSPSARSYRSSGLRHEMEHDHWRYHAAVYLRGLLGGCRYGLHSVCHPDRCGYHHTPRH